MTADGPAVLSPRERQIIERLVAARRRFVSDEVLVDALWGGQPPKTARKTLQGYVHRIRAAVGDSIIVRSRGGYGLGPTVRVDVEMVVAEFAAARIAVAEHRSIDAAVLFDQALARFRGQPDAHLADDPAVASLRAELNELELAAQEEALVNLLTLGQFGIAVSRLEVLVSYDPTRERAWCLLVEALAHSGRQADALDTVGRARRALAQHLGVDPGPRLRELERSVLEQRFRPTVTDPASQITDPKRAVRQRATQAGALLVGRADEQARILAALARAATGDGAAVLLRGETGIGKSSLLDWTSAAAGQFEVVRASAVESEAELGFAALRDLLRPLTGVLDLVPGALGAILEAALSLGPGVQADRLSVSVAALELCRAAAGRQPLALLVDDLHWADRASADVLWYLARRLSGERIVLVITARAEWPLVLPENIEIIDIGQLSSNDAAKLLVDRSAFAPAVAGSVARATAGNPLALTEAARGLNAAQRGGSEALPDPLPLGERLSRAYEDRLALLPARTQQALVVLASYLDDSGQDLDQALAGRDLRRADLEAAERASLVTYAERSLRFTHPLVRSAVLHRTDPPERRAALRAVALSESNAERRAWGLALATQGRDEPVARLLDQAGDAARSRLALSAAAAAYERSARIGDVPEAPRRLIQAGAAAVEAGLHEDARRLALEVRDRHPGPPWGVLAEQLEARVEVTHGRPARAAEILVRHAEAAEHTAPADAAVLYANATMVSFTGAKVERAMLLAERARDLAVTSGDEHVRAIGLTIFAAANVLAGNRGPARELPLGVYLEANEPAAPNRTFLPPAQFLVWGGRYADSSRVLDPDIARCQEAGMWSLLPYKLACRAELAYHVGDWAAGRRDAEEAVAIAEETNQANMLTFAQVTLARLDAAQGRTGAAKALARAALRAAEGSGSGAVRPYASAVLGLAALADGDLERAREELRAARDHTRADGVANPIVVPFAPDLIETLSRSNDRAGLANAVAALDSSDGAADDAWICGVAARGHSLLASNLDDAIDWSRRSVEYLAQLPFERARSLICLGLQQRGRHRVRDAFKSLGEAATLLADLGAAPWLAVCEAGLERATGVRPQARAELTAREQEIHRSAKRISRPPSRR